MTFKEQSENLLNAQSKALLLFDEAVERNYFTSGQTEEELNKKVYLLADELLGIKKFWHKRIVRAGSNTLLPYKENPENLMINDDDILFLDFGPVLEDWEADIGRTYVIGNNPDKVKIAYDAAEIFKTAKHYFQENQADLTAHQLFNYVIDLAAKAGHDFGGWHCGHLIGEFPHEVLMGDKENSYLHEGNHIKITDPDENGLLRHWILEVHLVNREKQIGAFYEQLLTF